MRLWRALPPDSGVRVQVTLETVDDGVIVTNTVKIPPGLTLRERLGALFDSLRIERRVDQSGIRLDDGADGGGVPLAAAVTGRHMIGVEVTSDGME